MATGSTGEKCKVGGIYYCSKHPSNEIPIAEHDTFPPCNTSNAGSHGATWILKHKAK
jgi:hypothetical protein